MSRTARVHVTCLATLAGFQPQEPLEISKGETPENVRRRLGIPRDEVNLVFVNKQYAKWDQPLADGDAVSFIPLVGGG